VVSDARRHLSIVYARGTDRLMWDLEKRPLPDMEAVAAVLAAGAKAHLLDIEAALVLVQAQRLDLDGAEYELIGQVHAAGVGADGVAAMLDLPGPAQAATRYQQLAERYRLPRAEAPPAEPRAVPEAAAEAARQAQHRAEAARARAEQAGQRAQQVREASARGHGPGPEDVERARVQAAQARMLADESVERTTLGLLRVAERLEASAAACQEIAVAGGGRGHIIRAAQYLREARRLRDLASGYGGDPDPDPDPDDPDPGSWELAQGRPRTPRCVTRGSAPRTSRVPLPQPQRESYSRICAEGFSIWRVRQ